MSYFITPERAMSSEGPMIIAGKQDGSIPRFIAVHAHARGQLLGASTGLLTVGTEAGQWVVPAIHAVWIPPHHRHSLRSHGPYFGWSVYVAEPECAMLPAVPCTLRSSGLLREAVYRAASWKGGDLNPVRERIARVILDEIAGLPHEDLGLPMPVDTRLARIAQAFTDNLLDERKAEEWAEWAGIPVRTMTRKFVVETGFTFTEWRQRARLMRALELLAAGEAVTSVALDVGYNNISAFIAMFRRVFGVTPTRYFTGEGS
ncbi:AraC family transcriptional regulator [Phyllobacterium myrsinacearum]|uniref:AraC-like DNA-binding protein n=1 Tax=Phyllobacterium myrsinacearum TaxID=28101 RepID=A0A839EG40_9HYPH|nr:helix-turn-helix transcriptional regulator [Phyllobacterium myrsinacearum]MBA8876564.1 AraC-like DNA-binding protein [Phyllobacterium myrsinacearum]